MSHWPEQPVNIIAKWLKSRNPSLTVADFGCGKRLFLSFTFLYFNAIFAFRCEVFLILITVTLIMSILGDARLAKSVKNKVFSIDLVAKDPSVIACDMSQARTVSNPLVIILFWNLTTSSCSISSSSSPFNPLQTPLESSSVDVAVFCLSLMGTNYPSYITEANRVLKPGYATIDLLFSIS